MNLSKLRHRSFRQLLTIFRTRYGRFTEPICTHDPSEIMVFITNRCNFARNTCPFTHDSPWSPPSNVSDISVDLFTRILDEHSGASMVGLVGGEPLLHPELGHLISIAADHKMTVNLSTNGSLLNNDRIHELLDSPLGYINISLDAVNADEFARLRGGSAETYAQVRENVTRLSSMIRSTGSKTQLFLSFVTDQHNISRINDFIETGRHLGAHTVFCQSVLSYQCSDVTTGEAILWDTPENQAILASLELPDDITLVPPVLVPHDEHEGCRCVRCVHPFKLLAVDGSGNLSPCCVIPPHSRFGNLVENPNAWRSGIALQAFRCEMLTDLDASEEICIHCWERYSLKE